MSRCVAVSILGLCSVAYAIETAAGQIVGESVPEFSKSTISNGFFALALVLGLLFVCVWLLRKLNGRNGVSIAGKMRIVGGIALGMRERIVLLQVGTKQLVLAVTPGRIETLAVLEGEECLVQPVNPAPTDRDVPFAQQLMQALKSRSDG
jgi:flagellar protein FliO/FliZ